MYILKGRIIDAVSDEPIENGLLSIEGDKIAYVGTAEGFDVPKNAEVIEADTILPGFIDCHAHLQGEEDAGSFAGGNFFGDQLLGAAHQVGLLVDSGFTGIRDMSEAGFYLSRAQERGILRSPRIMPGGKVLSITSGHVDFMPHLTKEEFNRNAKLERLCDGVDDCLLAVREQFRMGARFIKICATGGVSSPTDRLDDIQFSPEEMKTIVDEAKRHHTYVAAHCTGNEGAYQALQAGVECIEHGVMLTSREIDLMAKMDATLVTTLAVSLGVANIPGLPDWLHEKAKRTAEFNVVTIDLARKAGIRIALGTDYSNSKNTPFLQLGEEFEAMTRAGMTPMEAIRAGTVNAAYLLKNDNIGTLEVGKTADITMVCGNPLESIACLSKAENVKAVFIGGKKVK